MQENNSYTRRIFRGKICVKICVSFCRCNNNVNSSFSLRLSKLQILYEIIKTGFHLFMQTEIVNCMLVASASKLEL